MLSRINAVAIAILAVVVRDVAAEKHTITFTNDCEVGLGTPVLMQGDNTLSTGPQPFTIDGPLVGAIAFLQTGRCGGFGGLPGNGCGIVEINLVDPSMSGSNSTADISLIFPFPFNVVLGFEYFNGCDGLGANCTDDACPGARHVPTDIAQIITCDADNVGLAISFCALPETIPTVQS
ncbi:hypothetical protein GGX14DRAFT_559630 [Mycena pura]|uniref:Glycopeptide n=1 Tax=Mycena pura TaxID=153505 RepID=A0AAD6YGY5_9AGAR|nr:hypothetical protein GGX14DRAFT_559630 [Mycena pura]